MRVAIQCYRCPSEVHRRGAVFAYVMAYLSLTLLLLGLTGTMLHVVLKTSATDQRLFRDLARLRDAERALRDDAESARQVQLEARHAVFEASETRSVWTIDRHLLQREVLQDGQRKAVMNVRFRPGTLLSFKHQSDGLLALSVTLPAATLTTSDRRDEPAAVQPSRTVEILLPRSLSVADEDTTGNEEPASP